MGKPVKRPERATRETRPNVQHGRHNFETAFGRAAGDTSPLAKLHGKLGIDDSRVFSPFDTAEVVDPKNLDDSHRSIGAVALELGLESEELEDYIMERQLGLIAVQAGDQDERTYYMPEFSYIRTIAHFSG